MPGRGQIRFRIGTHIFPLSTVQEIVALNDALKKDLERCDNNLDAAEFYSTVVSKKLILRSFVPPISLFMANAGTRSSHYNVHVFFFGVPHRCDMSSSGS